MADCSNLLLLKVTDGLNGHFAFDRGGGVAWFQLNDGPGSLIKTSYQSFKFIQLFFLLLKNKLKKQIRMIFSFGISFPCFAHEQLLTTASCSRSSRRVAVVERSQLYFFFMFSCIFFILSWASFTSAKNWGNIRWMFEHFITLAPQILPLHSHNHIYVRLCHTW